MVIEASERSLSFVFDGLVEGVDLKDVEDDHAGPDALEDEGLVGSAGAEPLVVEGDVEEVVREVEGVLEGREGGDVVAAGHEEAVDVLDETAAHGYRC